LPAARQTPNMEENQGFRAFQLAPPEAPPPPGVWSDASEPSSGRWNYEREMAERILPKVATSTSLLGSFTCRKARHGTDGGGGVYGSDTILSDFYKRSLLLPAYQIHEVFYLIKTKYTLRFLPMFIHWLLGFSRISRKSARDGTGSVTAPLASKAQSSLQRLGDSAKTVTHNDHVVESTRWYILWTICTSSTGNYR
jgi:hypothetical protein